MFHGGGCPQHSGVACSKLHVLRELEAGKTVVQAAREDQVQPHTITTWPQRYAR
jgi:transposase-like protein